MAELILDLAWIWPIRMVLAVAIAVGVAYRRGARKLPITKQVPRDHGYKPDDKVTFDGKDYIVLLTSETTITIGRYH